MEQLSKEIIAKFKSGLSAKLKSELDYYSFEFTPAAKTWLDSVVEYYLNSLDNIEEFDDILEFIDDLQESERDEDECFDWPSASEAAVIIDRALAEDSSHFEYITEMQNRSMRPVDCFKAEWFWEGSMRPEIFNWLEFFLTDNI